MLGDCLLLSTEQLTFRGLYEYSYGRSEAFRNAQKVMKKKLHLCHLHAESQDFKVVSCPIEQSTGC